MHPPFWNLFSYVVANYRQESRGGKLLLCGLRTSSFIAYRAQGLSLCWPHWTSWTISSETDICCLPWWREALVWILWLRQPNWQDFASGGSGWGILGGYKRERETGHHIPTKWHKTGQKKELLHDILPHLSQHPASHLFPSFSES